MLIGVYLRSSAAHKRLFHSFSRSGLGLGVHPVSGSRRTLYTKSSLAVPLPHGIPHLVVFWWTYQSEIKRRQGALPLEWHWRLKQSSRFSPGISATKPIPGRQKYRLPC